MSTITAASTELKPSDVLAMSEGDRDELADGRLVELDVGSRSQYAATLLTWMLMNHCKPIGLAHVLMEAGYTCFPGRPNQMRRPDVTCIRADRLPFEEIACTTWKRSSTITAPRAFR
jgi:hypothetical protein